MRPPRQDAEYLNVVRRLFDAEAEILETLGKHPQIPQLLAFFEENHQFSLVQEFVRGHAMDNELTSGKRLKQAQVVEMLKEVLHVLVFVHSYGVIHRDIKPSNLIRREFRSTYCFN
ncbi:protein kinase domain-containing protein [Nostoc sp.]|uniref:protein kinase domain-containing protein n=1 Tax=Nostoc sp. TaxID=1180 RepID=UPI002FF561ED